MAATPTAKGLEQALEKVRPEIRQNLRSLVSKAKYEAPKVASFPIDGMTISGPISLAGNL